MLNPMLMEASKKTPEQLQADMLAAQEKMKAKMESDLNELDKMMREGWMTIPVPVGEQEIEVGDGGDQPDYECVSRTVTRTRFVNAYCRLKIKGDPSTMEFRLPLHPEVAAQYEVRNIPALNLIRKDQMSRDLKDLQPLMVRYSMAKFNEGVALAKGYHADVKSQQEVAEAIWADILYVITGDTGE